MNQEIIEMEEATKELQPMIKHFYHSRSSIVDFKTRLLGCVLNNSHEEIQNTVKYYPENIEENLEDSLRKYKYKDHDNKSILIIACINGDVRAKTLDILCSAMKSKYESIDCIDETLYGWEPIHYVAKTANLEKLKIVLKYIPESINALTYFSENALHILLQYEKSVTPFNIVLFNGIESKSSTILGPEKDTILDCAKLLIEQGIDVNHTNFWNETAICLAVRYRYTHLINHLLTIDYIDLDSFIESGKTIREYLKWNLYRSLPQSYVQEDPFRIRFNFLKSGDEENFLRYNSENISDNVNCFDGVDDFNSCGTMLQFCMRKGYLEFIQDKRSKIKRLTGYNIKDSPMLTVFQSKGLARCIIFLLDNGAEPAKTCKKFPTTLLEYSALRGYYPFVAILLEHKFSTISSEEIFSVLSKIFKTEVKLTNQAFYRNCVIYLLLNKLVFLFRQRKDEEILTPRKKSILNRLLHRLNLECNDKSLDDSNIICQILHLGASLTAEESASSSTDQEDAESGKMVVERIDPSVLKSHFDDCIHGTRFQYDSLIQDDDVGYNENKTLHFLVNNKSKRFLLGHPLIIELVRKKWSRVSWVFYIDLGLYLLFLLSIYIFTISLQFNCCQWYFNMIFYFLLSFHVLKEGLQLVFLYRWTYFTPPNILEMSTIASCFVTIAYPNVYSSVTAILFATFIFFVMLGQLPFFTKYTVIFSSIKYFFQYTGFYFIQFISFALCFFIVFPYQKASEGPKLEDIPKNLFFTLIYFTGEFSDRVLEPTEYPVFGRILMTVFIFCMTIILNNLLVGLIVSDMEVIRNKGRLYKQVKLASFIQSTNIFVERLHRYKSCDCIKTIINRFNIFRKGHKKVFENIDLNNFDDESQKFLRELKNLQIFDRHILRDVYAMLKSNVN